jgi:hypothetical protein
LWYGNFKKGLSGQIRAVTHWGWPVPFLPRAREECRIAFECGGLASLCGRQLLDLDVHQICNDSYLLLWGLHGYVPCQYACHSERIINKIHSAPLPLTKIRKASIVIEALEIFPLAAFIGSPRHQQASNHTPWAGSPAPPPRPRLPRQRSPPTAPP